MENSKLSHRLDTTLRSWSVGTKKEIHSMINDGRICVNGVAVNTGAIYIYNDDIITLDGNVIQPMSSVTIIMNKPKGYVCVSGASPYPSVFSLLAGEYADAALFAIGRLDADTEGLLLMTNSGELSEKISRPESEITKVYHATFDRPLPQNAESILSSGVTLKGGSICRPAILTRLSDTSALISVTEGKYHEVKRLIRACGARVATLKRISIGGLVLDEVLSPGEYRQLSDSEIARIFEK
jgi:16S rRNA pseudouridine516 synthase